MAEHLDHLHYLNDILCLNITDLNQVLTDHLLHKLLIPLYIYSLSTSRQDSQPTMETVMQNLARVLNRTISVGDNAVLTQREASSNGKVSSIVALFLLSQVFLIISHAPLIQTIAWIILKCDKSMTEKGVGSLYEFYENVVLKKGQNEEGAQCSEVSSSASCSSKENLMEEPKNVTDEEKLATTPTDGNLVSEKPFLETIYNALDCGENDYTALFALSLLYAMANNKGKRERERKN